MGMAWQLPGSLTSAYLGAISALCLVLCLRRAERPYFAAYIAGFAVQTPGFYWLIGTISDFGGFTLVPTFILYLLFVAISATQFLIIVFLWKSLPKWCDALSIKLAIALTLSEIFSIRIFPWAFGHTQLGFIELAQIADIAGAQLVTFMLVASAEALANLFIFRTHKKGSLAIIALLLVSIGYGHNRINYFNNLESPKAKVALVQANISIEEKHNIKFFKRNTEQYIKLTKEIEEDGLFVIWPESVITDWIYESTGSLDRDLRLPKFESKMPMLVGSLTYRDQKTLFNSAMAIHSDGSIPIPYHKQILMPFGEFTPFGDILPFLKELNATAGDFTPGKSIKVFNFPSQSNLKAAPLICYEDIVPSLARNATKSGASVLVNITNDAWFADTHAPYQHHLIAAFRSIENRRTLIRSTNSGLTAIVNPIGKTTSQLKTFSSGVLIEKVKLLDESTIYTKFLGDWPFRLLILLPACTILIRQFK